MHPRLTAVQYIAPNLSIMKHRDKHFVIVILLCCWVTALAAPSFASTSICGDIFFLKTVQKQSAQTQAIPNPHATLQAANRLLAKFSALESQVANPALDHASHSLLRMLAKLDRLVASSPPNPEIIAPSAYLDLSGALTALTQIENIFGCDKLRAIFTDVPSNSPQSGDGELMAVVGSLTAMAVPYALLPFFAISIAIVAAFIYKSTRREDRKICRTSLLIVYGKQCTVSHIVDIGRNGMKIEASKKEVENPLVDLYFCGHSVQGKIAWRNKFYVGIRFKTKISRQMLDDVIDKSHKGLADSNLNKKATPCFHYGCHINCAHHLPTAISEKEHSGS